MPHINRIRVNNVKYNFGTQSYDDFVMRLSGKNTIYDLANGGGKSVLMLLLLQNMIPNCTLDEKQPIEKLFRSGNDNKVIHSLIEWELNPCHIKNGFRYMTTGFCARKAKEDSGEEKKGNTAPIDYFNYCIFYREVNPNDIVNLPLQTKNEKITYQGLKNYLRDIGKKDYNIEVHIFDGKGEYQRFVSQYGIYESEWELIRGINKTEGHVRTFFETHYRTTRKVVEDLFIEEIIEKSYKTKWEDEDGENIAKTLLDIKDKLVELARKKGEIEHFDLQSEALLTFCDSLFSMKGVYGEKSVYEEKLVKTCRTVLERELKMKADFEEDTKKLEEFNGKLLEIERDIERGKIAIEEIYLNDLSDETNKLRAECNSMEDEIKAREHQLLLCEASNSYFEYVENEKQMKMLSNAIFDISGKNGDLLEELHELAYQLTKLEENELKEEESRADDLNAQLNKYSAIKQEFMVAEKNTATEIAIKEKQLEQLEKNAAEVGKELEEKRQFSNLSLVEDVYSELSAKENVLQQLKNDSENLRNEERSLIEMLARMEARKNQSDEQLAVLVSRKNEYKEQLDKLQKIQEEIHRMEEVYKESGEQLLSCVEKAYTSTAVKLSELKALNGELENTKNKLEKGVAEQNSDYKENDKSALLQALKYIKRHYDDEAVVGEEYLKLLSEEQRQSLIEAVPYIGACIVMTKNLQEAAFDEALSLRLPWNESVVLVLKSAVEAKEEMIGTNSMLVVANTPVGLLDEANRKIMLEKTKNQISENEREIKHLEDCLEVIRNDLFVLEAGLHDERQNAEYVNLQYEKLNEEHRILLENIENFTDNYNMQKSALAKCYESLEQNAGVQNKISDEIKLCTEIKTLYENLVCFDNEITELKNEINLSKKSYSKITSELKAVEYSIEDTEKKAEISRKNIELKKSALAKYEVYRNDKEYPEKFVDKNELEQLFGGKVMAFKEKSGDISDKQKMLELYRSAMDKNASDIKYRGFVVEELRELAKNGEITKMSIQELADEKEKLNSLRKSVDDISREYSHKQSQYDRQLGTVTHGKLTYREKFEEDYVNCNEGQQILQLQNFVSEKNAKLKLYKEKGKELKVRLRAKEKELVSLESLGAELKGLIENYDISMDSYSGILDEDVELTEACRQIRKDYQRLSKQEQKCRESFEKDKAQLIEKLHSFEAEDLSDEIQKQLTNPSSIKEIETYIENINQTISCIKLEKSRIGQSIELMEIMKDNFVKQCLQTCVSIKEGLERLPKLSNIQLDNQIVSMIQLQIPYIDESLYEMAMDEYISRIVENVDSIDNLSERLKYIRTHLAWKKLFSVIVVDMDKIRLQLYKRERMKEQSRYLKYEEAVGSMGQSQGIYIQFLVAVINYISSMNSGQSQGEILRKVIFIDNPFGAAKDVYIWEPIFAMLKSNHVQLVVPARGATPAITGRFEVNYILGQKLIDGRQQTVVVDYRSQVDEKFLEYKELEYIQSTFENI